MTQSYRDYSERNVSQLPQYKRIVLRLFYFYGAMWKATATYSFEGGEWRAGSIEEREKIYNQCG